MMSSGSNAVGRSAEVIVTDPWEFMTELGTEPLKGRVTSFEETEGRVIRIVVELVTPVTYRGRRVEIVSATPRHRDAPNAEAVLKGAGIPANMEGTLTAFAEHHPIALVGEIRIL